MVLAEAGVEAIGFCQSRCGGKWFLLMQVLRPVVLTNVGVVADTRV